MPKFVYKGRSIEQLQEMGPDELRQLFPARLRRSLKRGFSNRQKKLLERIRQDPKRFHKTHARDMIILPQMVGIKLGVHNGKEFVPLEIKPEMIGHRISEFVLTRKPVKHSAPGFGATKSSKFIPLK
jgi:small subunit ribosomal protein S19